MKMILRKELTLKDIENYKLELEKQILKGLHELEHITGCAVNDLELIENAEGEFEPCVSLNITTKRNIP